MEGIFNFIPECCALERPLDNVIKFIFLEPNPVQLVAGNYVVVDTHHGKRIRFLKYHPDLPPENNRLHCIDIIVFEIHFTGDLCTGDKFVHPVYAPDKGCLAAS